MIEALLFLTPVWPLVVLVCSAAWRFAKGETASFGFLWLTAPLPGLLLAVLAEPDPAASFLELPGLFLGALWWLDEVRLVFLLMTSLLWLLAGCYARGYLKVSQGAKDQLKARLRSFEYLWLLTLAGNLLLIVAEDIASFYTGFAIMTFSGYGLVIHFRSHEGLAAGRSYLYLALLGEGLLLIGFLGAASQAAEPLMSQIPLILEPDNSLGLPLLLCLLLGFGVKAGLALLHVWLPVAHSVAPTPASAVLSGAMIKAGLLGWWLTLPLGTSNWPEVGQALLLAGLVAALGAGLLGALQFKAKAVLAYSSISQMGMMTSLVGVGLLDFTLWPALVPVLLLFLVHHGLNKGSLFLAVGMNERLPLRWTPLLWLGLVLPPLALVGWLGSGTLNKTLMKGVLYEAGWQPLVFWLTLAGLATSLLMFRYLWLLYLARQQLSQQEKQPQKINFWMLGSWLLLLILGLLTPWWLPLSIDNFLWPDQQGWLDLAWPVLAGLVLAVLAWALTRRSSAWQKWVPPLGDLLVVYRYLGLGLLKGVRGLIAGWDAAMQQLVAWLGSLKSLGLLMDKISYQEIAWRREAALIFTLLLVVLSGLLLL
ncbi:Formate hydrogenlyase subunit 3/Multisubunit Na+/H+ antiporter, MnhD subunit [Marinospirillum celere]|uniref:Formate hydrogenlyase subunit 3/Multisubunit Na+/H+ antiporter, MnhD subunit n=1 Tax=Marinospirillum celere TaxID=1122252 RepID=A0A1I1FP94_9GAMM|nr:proton-conducting transporter membrane subunit [Marinospirillum celere]SFC01359.1 Formate hydrogenlyase subunit 3/Multisubunit Na+/H+ antiporter, MnhD subunit [Marinospirillum celere]